MQVTTYLRVFEFVVMTGYGVMKYRKGDVMCGEWNGRNEVEATLTLRNWSHYFGKLISSYYINNL